MPSRQAKGMGSEAAGKGFVWWAQDLIQACQCNCPCSTFFLLLRKAPLSLGPVGSQSSPGAHGFSVAPPRRPRKPPVAPVWLRPQGWRTDEPLELSTSSGLGREGEAVREAVRKGALKKGMFLKPKQEKRRGTGEKKMSIWRKKKKKGEEIGFGSKEFGETREIFLSLYPHLPSPPDPAPGPLKPSSPQE